MMASRRGGIIFILLLMASLWGCSSAVTLAPSPLASPFFPPTAEDAKRVEVLTHELDNQAVHCLEASNCAEVHFARALVSLFENQQAASLVCRQFWLQFGLLKHQPQHFAMSNLSCNMSRLSSYTNERRDSAA